MKKQEEKKVLKTTDDGDINEVVEFVDLLFYGALKMKVTKKNMIIFGNGGDNSGVAHGNYFPRLLTEKSFVAGAYALGNSAAIQTHFEKGLRGADKKDMDLICDILLNIKGWDKERIAELKDLYKNAKERLDNK